ARLGWNERERPLDIGQGLRQPPELIERIGPVVEGIGIIGIERERLVVARKRLLLPPEPGERAAAIVMRWREIGRERQHMVEALDGGLAAPEVDEHGAPVAPVLDRIRLERERAIVALDRLVGPAERDQRIGAAAIGIGRGSKLERAIEARERLGVAAGAAERHAEELVEAGLRRGEGEGLAEEIDAFAQFA